MRALVPFVLLSNLLERILFISAHVQRSSLAFVLVIILTALTGSQALGQGPLTNGWLHTGNISAAGVSNSWTFSANAGDTIVIRAGEVFNNAFGPRLQIQTPTSVAMASASGTVTAEIAVTATNSGTFTVNVSDNVGTQTNLYHLTLARIPGNFTTTPGDNGGPMTNGVTHTGTILPGDLDVWTFNANTGDAIVVRMGMITTTNTFSPFVRLYGPDGKLLDSGSGTFAGEATVTATNSGTFTVVAADGNGNYSGSGDYRLTLAKTGDPVVISAGDEGGPMTNAVTHSGTILTGDVDVWTFNANAGDAIVVRIGMITTTNSFTPWLRLYGPNGSLLDSGFGASAGEVSVTATNSGTFTVVAADGNGAISGSGNYRLTLAKTGDPVIISAGDEGGPMTNAVMHTGTLTTGDLDVWTFNANSGDALLVRIGMITATNSFTPWLRLYGPNGKLLSSGAGTFAGEVLATATNSGTFLVVAADGNGAISGSGTYRLTLAKTGDPVVISAGDDGGPMTNGVMHTGVLLTGDLDVWTFNANSGDALVARIGMITATNTFTPWVRLYGPNGKLLSSGAGTFAGEVLATATNSGTFLVVAGDGNGAISGSGAYRLTLAKTGDPVVVSAGDEGGPATNGFMHLATISTGDLDLWTFNANSGDGIIVRIGELNNTNTFTPWLRLYGPAGALLGSSAGSIAAEVSTTATNNGTYLIVAGDGNGALSGSGDYRLTLSKTGAGFVVLAGDEGGSLDGSLSATGTISAGDIDSWSFTICKGEPIHLHVDELTDTSGNFAPWLRLYGPSGARIGSVSGSTTADLAVIATNSGTFVVVVSDGNGALSGTGTYSLTNNGLADGFRMCMPIVSGTTANLTGVGGSASANGILFTSTNLLTPRSQWTPIHTNQFDEFGVIGYTNLFDPTEPKRFFILLEP